MALQPSVGYNSLQQEQFSNAYLQAIASVAGCVMAKPNIDDDSVDWTLSCKIEGRPKLDIQLKSTVDYDLKENIFKYDLETKNYRDLIISDILVPRILVVLFIPQDISEWLSQRHKELMLRRCAYWKSLKGFPPTENKNTIRVDIPYDNPFTVVALKEMMIKIGKGESL
ncbi:MAG: DUF4365 domain-containing protein [Candidatus Omnitrophota bacterium]